MLRYSATQQDAGKTVYTIMRRQLFLSAALTRRLKRAGAIAVDGRPVFTNRAVSPGETVEIDLAAAEAPGGIVPECGPLRVLYEDGGLLAVDKPAGLLTHPSRSQYTGTLANYVLGYLSGTGSGCHAVNRLDRDTTGVVLFAKNSHLKARAAKALAADGAAKEYCALVSGHPEPRRGTIDLPIRRLRPGDMLRTAAPDGQPAATRYETVWHGCCGGAPVSLLRLILETGRTHQIRVHCLASGFPVLGDGLYATQASRAVSAALGVTTQALHAWSLAFTEPISSRPLVIRAPLPPVFSRLVGPGLPEYLLR